MKNFIKSKTTNKMSLHKVANMAMKMKNMARVRMERNRERMETLKSKEFKELSWSEKLDWLVNEPFDWLRKLTIPPCEKEKWDDTSEILIWVWPVPSFLFFAFATTMDPQWWWLYGMYLNNYS